MHELAITQSLLEKTLVYAKENALKKIESVHIQLGVLSGFVDDSIDFYWHEISKDTLAFGSKVIIDRLSGKMKCLDCLQIVVAKKNLENCLKCGSKKLLIVEGDTLLLDKIEGSI